MRRALGIDLGTRRMGVAVTDGLGLTAQPIDTIQRHGGKRDIEAIAALIRKYEVETVVVGLPENPQEVRGLSGDAESEGRTARLARAFAESLHTQLGLPVELIDESFSTVEAEAVLLKADLSRARRKEVVDRVAAAIILQRWLDRQRSSASGPTTRETAE